MSCRGTAPHTRSFIPCIGIVRRRQGSPRCTRGCIIRPHLHGHQRTGGTTKRKPSLAVRALCAGAGPWLESLVMTLRKPPRRVGVGVGVWRCARPASRERALVRLSEKVDGQASTIGQLRAERARHSATVEGLSGKLHAEQQASAALRTQLVDLRQELDVSGGVMKFTPSTQPCLTNRAAALLLAAFLS